MIPFKFIHTADIHLDSPLKGLEAHTDAPVEEIRAACRRAFIKLVDFAITEQIHFLLIAGDLYDGNWKDYHTGLFFAKQMGRLNGAGIKVFIVSGNHDAASQISKSLPLPDNVTVFSVKKPESIILKDSGIVIHGQSYATRIITDNMVKKYPERDENYLNIGMLHTSLNGRVGHESYAPCSIDDLKSKGYHYWALGHVHQRELVTEHPWIVFPGNIQGRHCKETGAKGATLVTVDDGDISKVEHVDFDVLRWAICQVDLSGCNTAADVQKQVKTAIEQEEADGDNKTLALRLILTGSCPLHNDLHARTQEWLEDLHSIVAGFQGVWLETVKIRTRPEITLNELLKDDSPVSSLLHTIDEVNPDEHDISTLLPELADLANKLPPALQNIALLQNSRTYLAEELLPDVRELLVARLVARGKE